LFLGAEIIGPTTAAAILIIIVAIATIIILVIFKKYKNGGNISGSKPGPESGQHVARELK
jgi:hypothetical protein